jgi:membrane protease YdiL (CAAX protease family)
LNEANPVEQEKVGAVPTLDAVLVIVVTFFLEIILGTIFIFTLGTGAALILGELVILFVPLGYLLLKRVNVKSYVASDVTPKFILLGIGFGVLLLFLNGAVTQLLTNIFGTSQAVEESSTMLTNLSGSTSGLIVVIASLSLAGVCEEFAFRGFLQNTINRRYSFIPAVIVSSVTFGLFHFDPQLVYTLSTLVAGLLLGYIYHRWSSYVVSATAHSTMNLIVLVVWLLTL